MGYSKNSPAYLVYNLQTREVSKHRLVKFIKMNMNQKPTASETESQKLKRVTLNCYRKKIAKKIRS